MRLVYTATCPLCEASCGILVDTDGEHIRSIRGAQSIYFIAATSYRGQEWAGACYSPKRDVTLTGLLNTLQPHLSFMR